MRNKKVCDNVCLGRFKWSFFFISATALPQTRGLVGLLLSFLLKAETASPPKRALMAASLPGIPLLLGSRALHTALQFIPSPAVFN